MTRYEAIGIFNSAVEAIKWRKWDTHLVMSLESARSIFVVDCATYGWDAQQAREKAKSYVSTAATHAGSKRAKPYIGILVGLVLAFLLLVGLLFLGEVWAVTVVASWLGYALPFWKTAAVLALANVMLARFRRCMS